MNPNWGKDKLTKFIDVARQHSLDSFSVFYPLIESIISIDSLFLTIQENLNHSGKSNIAFFFLRLHSSYRASIGLALNGQLPETYALLRICIENSLYGFYFNGNPDAYKTWLSRHDSEEAKTSARNELTIGKMLRYLETIEPKTYKTIKPLYEFAIDSGAHPNPFSISASLRYTKNDDGATAGIAYISGDKELTNLCFQQTALVGIGTLKVFQHVFKERYDILGVSNKLDLVKI